MRKTKIICTLGPATDRDGVLRELMLKGMSVARLNFSHDTYEGHKRRADAVKALREELGLPVALLMDTKGPEIRLGTFESPVELVAGQPFLLTTREVPGTAEQAHITFSGLPNDVSGGSRILIDDGLIELRVEKCTETDIFCVVLNGGMVSSRKSINVPGTKLSLPYMSDQDRKDLRFAVEQDFDFVAASFTRSGDDVRTMRHEMELCGGQNLRLISKIENADGVENIDEIISLSDGIMIARGDLGVEIPLEEIPVIQKKLIKKAYNAGLQVITATQMLDSMMKNPRPTRAESTDVANAIYDGTSAIMLSGETAAGAHPLESLITMDTIAERTERDIDYKKRFLHHDIGPRPNVTSAISHATCTSAHDLGAVAIMTVSKSGKTARMISKFRPDSPIICGTTEKKVWRQMNLSWGVIPIMVQEQENTDALFEHVVGVAAEQNLVKNGDLVVITAGVPLGVSGTTNLLKVHLVGNVLAQGSGITQFTISGNLCVCKNEEEALQHFNSGDILVIPSTSNHIVDLMKSASGIITEVDGKDSHAAIVGMALDKPVIVGAQYATKLLKTGTTITMDATRGIVYSGDMKP